MSWFRIHTRVLHDPKIQQMPGHMVKAWLNLLCLAKMGDGLIPPANRVAFHLRCGLPLAEKMMEEFVSVYKLMDRNEDGTFRPHDWNEHQYKSDVSTERVREFRQRSTKPLGNVSETPSEYRVQSTESETEEKSIATAAAAAPKLTVVNPVDVWFSSEFWPNWIKRTKDIREAALIAARKHAKTVDVRNQIMASVASLKDSRLTEDPEFRISARRWIAEGHWKSTPETPEGRARDSPGGNGHLFEGATARSIRIGLERVRETGRL